MSISRFILPFILVILSGVMYVMYIDPTYKDILELRNKKVDFSDAISKASEVRDLQAKLLAEVESINEKDRARLEKILPSSYDPVLLLYDLNNFAQKRGLSLKAPAVQIPAVDPHAVTSAQAQITSVFVKFGVSAPYGIFKSFISDFEKELALRDIKSVSMASTGDTAGTFDGSVFTYQIEVEGYAYREKEKTTKSTSAK